MHILPVGLFLILMNFAWSETLRDVVTPPGRGAEYDVRLAVGEALVQIYFVEPPRPEDKAVEMFFELKDSFVPIQLWQQFHISQKGVKLDVEKGFLYADLFQTRQLDREYLAGFDGVQMNQFLISSEKELKEYFVAREKIKVKAGQFKADHYRVKNSGQTVDFWIHHASKPIGLIQLISTGAKTEQSYTLTLSRMIQNVPRKIDPKRAQPMDDLTRSFLPSPGSQKLKGLGLF